MGSKNEELEFYSSSNGATRKQVKSLCRTVEVEPGRFFRKCAKMQQTLEVCDGRPTKRIEYNAEFNEKDVTDQMVKESFPLKSANPPALKSNLTGLRSDREATFRPTEKIGCKKEYNEKDVMDQMVKDSCCPETVEDNQEYNTHFPGLRSDIEAIERSFFQEVYRLYESAKDMTEFINLVKVPRMVKDPPAALPPKEDV